jgi:TatD DNase family protein
MTELRLADTHAHLEMEPFDPDRPEVIRRARQAGLAHVLCVGTGRESTRACVELARAYPDLVRAAAGIHPSFWSGAGADDMDEVARLAHEPEVVAVGETGLDFHYDYTPQQEQIEAFERHVQLALEADLPLVVHSRKAHAETLRVLLQAAEGPRASRLRGVRHCFDRPWARAEPFLELGFHISVGGAATRPGYKKFKEALRRMPADRLLLETDCPYQTPVPHKGQRNEPAFIADVARAVADLRDTSAEQIARTTTRNAERLFGL